MDLIEREDVYLAIIEAWTPKTDTIISKIIRAVKAIPNTDIPAYHNLTGVDYQERSFDDANNN